MEIKHTIEILTKDIQDIEKLVRNLNNYATPPRIELDLAMAKLRNVYELLSIISADLIEGDFMPVTSDQKTSQPGKVEGEKETGNSSSQTDSETHEILTADELPKPREAAKQESMLDFTENEEVVENTAAEVPQEKEAADDIKQVDKAPENTVDSERKDQAAAEKEEPRKASIIAEKFTANTSLNERIAPSNHGDLTAKYSGEPIDSIKRNIGINDRFLIIRELMGGDNEEFNKFVSRLDTCSNFNESFRLIEEKFPKRLEHEGVKILVNLSRRKFISSANV